MRLSSYAPSGLVLIFALAAPVATAAEPIATDRPDFVESSLTVGRGRTQLETSLARDDGGAWSTPTLLRIGLGDRWEARFESEGRLRADDGSGWGDLSVGLKYHLADRDGAPSMAWLLHADLPSGDGEPGRGVRPSVRFVAEWELTDTVGLGLMPGVALERDDAGHARVAGLFGAVVGRSVGERSRVFAEVAAERIGAGDDEVLLDLGGAMLLDNDTQLDVAYSRGLVGPVPDHAVTVGFSRRW